MTKSKFSLIISAALLVILLPLFFIALSAVFAFLFVLFWIIVIFFLWRTNPRFRIAIKALAVITLFTLIFVAILKEDKPISNDETIDTSTLEEQVIEYVEEEAGL